MEKKPDDRPTPQSGCWAAFSNLMQSRRMMALVGIIYLGLTLFGSWRFLTISAAKSLANDLLWIQFNATAGGVFVAMMYNRMAQTPEPQHAQYRPEFNNSVAIRLDDPLFLSVMDLSSEENVQIFTATAARHVHYHRLTAVEHGILGLRKAGAATAFGLMTQYCWVDFEQRWSLAHTQERANRCQRYKENGAMYLETLLRNVNFAEFTTDYVVHFALIIGDPIRSLEGGEKFLDYLGNHTIKPLDEEAAYWRKNGITHYALQYQNYAQIGLTDQIEIVNALGISSLFMIRHVEAKYRYESATTSKLGAGFHADLVITYPPNVNMITGRSLVRESDSFFEKDPTASYTMEEALVAIGAGPTPPYSIQEQLLRDHLGPFGSIDMFWTIYPSSLYAFRESTRRIVAEILMQNATAAQFVQDIGYLQANTMPIGWHPMQNWSYLGGSPLCTRFKPQSMYVVAQFSFEDVCAKSQPELTFIGFRTLVFGYLSSIKPSPNQNPMTLEQAKDTCASGLRQNAHCPVMLMQAEDFVTQHVPLQDRQAIYDQARFIEAELIRLNVSIMQFATRPSATGGEEHKLLVQPLLYNENDTNSENYWHALFGWVHLAEWADGNREVVSFEGDYGTLRLLSAGYSGVYMPLDKSEIVHSMSLYFQRGVQYVTIVLLVLAAMVLFYAIANKGDVAGLNFLDFNRVGGAVWIGRPLLLLRGIVAICILSTGRAVADYQHPGLQFVLMKETPQSAFNTILNAGETGWLVFVANDLLMFMTRGLTYQYALVSSLMTWTAVAIFQLVSPVTHTALFDPVCKMQAFQNQVTCTTGRVYTGHVERFVTIVVIILVCLLVSYVVVRLCCKPQVQREGSVLLLPGLAQELFTTDGWTHQKDWYLDPASAALAGLLTIRLCGISVIVDMKTWSLMRLTRGQLTTKIGKTDHGIHAIQPGDFRNQMQVIENLPTHLKNSISMKINTKVN